jgi:hypothetical protein
LGASKYLAIDEERGTSIYLEQLDVFDGGGAKAEGCREGRDDDGVTRYCYPNFAEGELLGEVLSKNKCFQ